MSAQNPNTACEHGHQARKCPYCELEELEQQRAAALKLARELRNQKAHTYASENADMYRGFDNGCQHAAGRIEAIFSPKEGK